MEDNGKSVQVQRYVSGVKIYVQVATIRVQNSYTSITLQADKMVSMKGKIVLNCNK